MSTGNYERYAPTENLQCGSVRVGVSISKSWNGGNDPNRAIPQPYTMSLVYSNARKIQYRAAAEPHRPLASCTTLGLIGPPTAIHGWTSNDDLKLISKLREEIVGSDFNLGIFLGESKSSLETITNCATRIYLSYRAIRKGNLKTALDIALGRSDTYNGRLVDGLKPSRKRDLLNRYQAIRANAGTYKRTAANQHLEVVYGWIPLLQDVQGAAEALAKAHSEPHVFRIAVGRRVIGKFNPSILRTDLGRVHTTTNLIAYMKEDSVSWPMLHGFNDPLQLMWELTPYSFVADWFYPVGAYLEARGVARALKGTFVTSKKVVMDAVTAPSALYVWTGSPSEYRTVSFKRSVSTSLNVPVPTVVGLSKAVSWLRASNAVALVTQRLAGK